MNFEAKSSLSTLKNGGCYQLTFNCYQLTVNSYHVNTLEILEKYISQNFGVFVFSQVREKIKTVFFLGAMFVINNIKTLAKEKEAAAKNNPSMGLFSEIEVLTV